VRHHMSLRVRRAEESTDGDSLSFDVTKYAQYEVSEDRLNLVRHLDRLVCKPRQYVVVVDSIFELFHKCDRLTIENLTGLERPFRDHENVEITAITRTGAENETIWIGICTRNDLRFFVFERPLVVQVLPIRACLILDEYLNEHLEVCVTVHPQRRTSIYSQLPLVHRHQQGNSKLLESYRCETHRRTNCSVPSIRFYQTRWLAP